MIRLYRFFKKCVRSFVAAFVVAAMIAIVVSATASDRPAPAGRVAEPRPSPQAVNQIWGNPSGSCPNGQCEPPAQTPRNTQGTALPPVPITETTPSTEQQPPTQTPSQPTGSSSINDKIEEATRRWSKLKNDYEARWRTELDAIKSQIDGVRPNTSNLERSIEELRTGLSDDVRASIDERLAEYNAAASRLTTTLDAIQAKLDAISTEIKASEPTGWRRFWEQLKLSASILILFYVITVFVRWLYGKYQSDREERERLLVERLRRDYQIETETTTGTKVKK